jgi:hypothetical protein
MKLSSKGRFQKPPVLKPRFAQALSESLASWQGVLARTHWQLGDETVIDGVDFYVGEEELGHIHLNGEAHIAIGPHIGRVLLKKNLAHRFPYSDEFVTFDVDSDDTRVQASWLFSLRYSQLKGNSREQILESIRAQAGLP